MQYSGYIAILTSNHAFLTLTLALKNRFNNSSVLAFRGPTYKCYMVIECVLFI